MSILICLMKKLTTKVHAYLSDRALAPDGLVDRDIMDATINEAREHEGISLSLITKKFSIFT